MGAGGEEVMPEDVGGRSVVDVRNGKEGTGRPTRSLAIRGTLILYEYDAGETVVGCEVGVEGRQTAQGTSTPFTVWTKDE